MPKKFVGENSKAAAARARKTATKEQQKAEKTKQIEDQYWQDDNKHILRKQQRKEEQERKKQNVADRKAENRALLEQEQSQLKSSNKIIPPPKTTRIQIQNLLATEKSKPVKEKVVDHTEVPLEENINHFVPIGEEARSVTEAIAILNLKQTEADKHPEKRMKAAYAAFEARRLQDLKEEQPTLRLSQLKQLIFKEWQKSPENPLNEVS